MRKKTLWIWSQLKYHCNAVKDNLSMCFSSVFQQYGGYGNDCVVSPTTAVMKTLVVIIGHF